MSGGERFALRSFRAGDETALASLAERAYSPYGGHLLRTAEHWRSSILATSPRLDPDSDLAVLSLAGDDPVGYGVLGADGLVLELCLDPELTGARRAVAAAVLIAALEERVRARGGDLIQLELPRLDGRIREALSAAGYRADAGPQLAVDLVDVAAALRGILAHRRGRMPHGWERCFVLMLAEGGDSGADGQAGRGPRRFVITARDGALDVEEVEGVSASGGTEGERKVAIATDRATLTGLIVRQITFDEAAAAGRLILEPADAEQDVRTLCEFLTLKGPWFMPPLDRRQGSGILSLKLEPGLALPFRFAGATRDGDGAATLSPDAAPAAERENQRSGVVFRGTPVGRAPGERAPGGGRLHPLVIGPGVGIRYRRILGPKPLMARVAAWGERVLQKPGVRARLAEPLRLEIQTDGLPAFRCVLADTGFRLEPSPDGGADVKLRVPYAWLNDSWPETGAVVRALGRGTFQLRPRPRAWGRVLALALTLARSR